MAHISPFIGSSLAQSLTDAVATNTLNGVAFEVEVFSSFASNLTYSVEHFDNKDNKEVQIGPNNTVDQLENHSII